jgi:transglutaminase-like putative cysteine protease
MNLPRPLSHLIFLSFVFSLLTAGCDLPKRPPLTQRLERPQYLDDELTSEPTTVPAASSFEPVFEPPAAPLADNWETWNAYYSEGKPIGFGHVTANRVRDAETGDAQDADVQYTIDDHLLIANGHSTVSQLLHHESVESSTGQLKSFRAIQSVGPLATHFMASVENGELTTITRRGATESTHKMAWEPTYRGLVAVEQSLRNSPIRPGEIRMLKTLLPVQHRVATVRLKSGKKASAPLLGGVTSELLETTGLIEVDENFSEVVLWTDDSGTLLKSYSQALGLLAFRTDETTASSIIRNDASMSSGIAVRVTGIIERPNEAKRTAFIIKRVKPRRRIDDSKPVDSLKMQPIPGQAQRQVAEDTVHVLVSVDSAANVPEFVTAIVPVSDTDTLPSSLIDFQSALVNRIHSAATVAGMNERETALEMARTVKGLLVASPKSLGLVKASDVAQSGIADSTGHAVLLAALLRASKIPARIVAGIVIDDSASSTMKYHAWTMAYVNGSWLPLDATIGREALSNRVALIHSDFADHNAESDMLALVRQVGELQIEIARSQY